MLALSAWLEISWILSFIVVDGQKFRNRAFLFYDPYCISCISYL